MRNTLQEQYNLIKEGKGAKDVFIKHAKSLFPHLIPNHYGFDNAAQILTQRGIISENLWGIATGNNQQPDWFKIFNEAQETNVKADATKTSKEVDEYKDKSYHNQYEAETGDDVIFDQYLRGIQIETCKDENADKSVADLKKMVLKNLKKDKLYYTKNAAFGIEGIGYTDEAPGLGKTKEVKGKYASSGMEPVKINEGFDEDKIARYKKYTYTLDGEPITPDDINFYDNLLGVEFNGSIYKMKMPDENGNINLSATKGKTGMFPESLEEGNLYESIKVGDKLKHKLTGAEMVVTKVNGNNLTTKITLVSNLKTGKVGDINKTSALLVGKTYDLIKESKSLEESVSEEMENSSKTYSVYELAFGQPYNFYNEEKNKFIWSEPKEATLYTKEEAEMKRKELLQPRIDIYQRTGENYKEIHIGDLYKKNILREANINIQESELRSAIRSLIKEELNLKEIDQIGEEASKMAKIKKVSDEIAKRKKKLKALETLKELEDDSINPGKIKELYGDVKKLEKMKEKLEKKGKKKEQIVDEIAVVSDKTTPEEVSSIVKTGDTTMDAIKAAVMQAKKTRQPVTVS